MMQEGVYLSTVAVTRLSSHDRKLAEKCREAFSSLKKVMFDTYEPEKADHLFSRIRDYSEMRLMLSELTAAFNTSKNDKPLYMISSEVLYDAYKRLSSTATEAILYAGGNRFGNAFTIERLVDLELDKSDYGYASANIVSSSKSLVEMEKHGSLLTCYFHAHPGTGSNSNHPSSVDLRNQKRMEKNEYLAIGGIFSRDGYVRFFSHETAFQICVSGKGVDYAAHNLYRLTEA